MHGIPVNPVICDRIQSFCDILGPGGYPEQVLSLFRQDNKLKAKEEWGGKKISCRFNLFNNYFSISYCKSYETPKTYWNLQPKILPSAFSYTINNTATVCRLWECTWLLIVGLHNTYDARQISGQQVRWHVTIHLDVIFDACSVAQCLTMID